MTAPVVGSGSEPAWIARVENPCRGSFTHSRLTASAQARGPAHRLRPIVFVHGFFGSGSQYETPARRFASNGYPSTYVEAHEYDSTFATTTVPAVHAALDA